LKKVHFKKSCRDCVQ